MTTRPEASLAQLAQLPSRDLDPWRAQTIRRRAHRELSRSRWLAAHPRLAAIAAFHRRVVEPAVVVGLSASYLAWAVNQVAALYR